MTLNLKQDVFPGATKLLAGTAFVSLISAMSTLASPGGALPFQIRVDGQVVDASGTPVSAPVPQKVVTANPLDIDIRFDGLSAERDLLARANVIGNGSVRFKTEMNYPAFARRGEIDVLVREGSTLRVLETLPVPLNGETVWQAQGGASGELYFRFRAIAADGRFDQTEAKPLGGKSDTLAGGNPALQNIPVHGGSVTISGSGMATDQVALVLNETIRPDASGQFIVQRIIPPGQHVVDVTIAGQGKTELGFARLIDVPESEFFMVAIADLTLGLRQGDHGIEAAREGEYDALYTKGRAAFYLKGKVRGDVLVTAAADLGEEDLKDLFGDLGGRNPRDYLRTLKPSDYYPVYGDDSTLSEDAPTSGKFYVRLDKGESHVMWGDYRTEITGTRYLASSKAYYGGRAVYNSGTQTATGAQQTHAEAYLAVPDSVQVRDEFRGTGGSAYFLRRQMVVPGSERVAIEVRDPTTGRVIQRQTLTQGRDYTLNPAQGTLLLARPAAWMTNSAGPTHGNADEIHIIVDYAYAARPGDIDGHSVGGRAEQWLGEIVRIGVTAHSEVQTGDRRTAAGADAKLVLSENSYLRGEVAVSQGTGQGVWQSIDGGLTFTPQVPVTPVAGAHAWEVEGRLDLADFGGSGLLEAYVEHRQAGFAAATVLAAEDEWRWGLSASGELSPDWSYNVRYDNLTQDGGDRRQAGEVGLSFAISETVSTQIGASMVEQASASALAAGKTGYNGGRLDIGARVDVQLDEARTIGVFGQASATHTGDMTRNDRAGVSFEQQVTEKLALSAEVSVGTHGPGLQAGVTYDASEDEKYYLAYELDPSRQYDINRSFELLGKDSGVLVSGLQKRLNEHASAYAESRYDMFGDRKSLAHSYGVLLTPDRYSSIDLGLVAGHLRDNTIDPGTGLARSDFDRVATSLSYGYVDDEAGIKGHARGELRIEESADHARSQYSALLSGGVQVQVSDDWRLVAASDGIFSVRTADSSTIPDMDYMETSIGYAYRPAKDDRLNALFRYSWVYDQPSTARVASGVSGDALAPAQNSHILSVDANYRVNQFLTLGAKYGLRFGSMRERIATGFGPARNSTAHLGILRADIHVVHDWDLTLEGRALALPETGTTDLGAVIAISKHINSNFQLGVGYNFGRFSDDLRDLTLNDHGVFLNLVAKY